MTRLTQEMWKSGGSNHGIFDPSEFRRQMGIFSPKFMGFDQHDSQEFFTYTLDGIHTELNRIEKNALVSKVWLVMSFLLFSTMFRAAGRSENLGG